MPLPISIHAPARGATRKGRGINTTLRYFNPRSREGSDESRVGDFRGVCNFNPRSREGSDLFRFSRFKHLKHFNPRSREGSDGEIKPKKSNNEISIHAPARGATICAPSKCLSRVISIHAPARGATLIYRKYHTD